MDRPRVPRDHFAMPLRVLAWVSCLAGLSITMGCAHRYSEDPKDWVGPHHEGRFEEDFLGCRARMDAKGFAYRADRRLILLDCMKKRGWTLKGAS